MSKLLGKDKILSFGTGTPTRDVMKKVVEYIKLHLNKSTKTNSQNDDGLTIIQQWWS